MQPRSFAGKLRIPLIERMMSSISSSTSLGQLLASSRLARDQTPSSGLIRGVGGKMLDSETRVLTEELLEWFPLMGGGIIQENDDRAA